MSFLKRLFGAPIERLSVKIGYALVVVGLLVLGLWVGRLFVTLRSLEQHLASAQDLSQQDPAQLLQTDPETLDALVRGLHEDVSAVQRQVGALAPLGKAFRWLPKIGPVVGQAEPLLDVATALSEAALRLWDVFSPVLVELQQDTFSSERALRRLREADSEIAAARGLVSSARAAYQQLEIAAYPVRLRGPLEKLGVLLPWLEDGLAAAEVAPTLLGAEVPKTYLLLALNETELRPGGGFITGVGEVQVAEGTLRQVTFKDSYAADDFSKPYPTAPAPLQQFLGLDLWVFRDSNWSPDFPTAAQKAITLYRNEDPVNVQGVVAFDQYAAQQIVETMEPLSVPGADEPVTGETFFNFIHQAWAPDDGELSGEWWQERKSFMGDMADAVLTKVKQGDVEWAALFKTLITLVEEKHLQLYFENDTVERLLGSRGWAGRLQAPVGDYLLVTETNAGYNKASPRIQRAMTYMVDLAQSPPSARLTIAYTHTSTVDYPCKVELRYDADYREMMDRCYWAYLHLYTPLGSEIVDYSRHFIPGNKMWTGEPWMGIPVSRTLDGTYAVIEQAFLLPTRSQEEVYVDYTLPPRVLQQEDGKIRYRLDVQKQPGLVNFPVDIVLRLPLDATLLDSKPSPARRRENFLVYEVDLRKDRYFEVVYR